MTVVLQIALIAFPLITKYFNELRKVNSTPNGVKTNKYETLDK